MFAGMFWYSWEALKLSICELTAKKRCIHTSKVKPRMDKDKE